jgi:hypothetical protein
MFNYLVTMLAVAVVIALVLLFWPWSGIVLGVLVVTGLRFALRPLVTVRRD